MSRIDKSVFIQNIEDTTTVLQQLRICIEQIKEVIDRYVENSELQSEVERATARENQIAGNLASETERATEKENEIIDDLDLLDGRVDVLEGEIAYVELSDNMTGTLTNEQYTNILKPNCVIKCFNRFFTKAVREGTTIVYSSHTSIDEQTSTTYLECIEIRIDANKTYILSGGSRAFYNKNQTDALLNPLKNEIGFIEISNTTGTLTDEQYAEALKPYCIICLSNTNFYYKEKYVNNIITFSRFEIGSYSTYWRLGETYINVSQDKTYQLNNTSLKTDMYSTTQTDTLLNSKQNALEFNPTIPSGTTPTTLSNLKDGNNYYSLGGGSQVYKHEIAILDSNDDGVGGLSLLSSNNNEAINISSLSSLLRNYGFAAGTYFYNSLEAVAIYTSSSNNVLVTYDDRTTTLTEQAGYSVYDTVTPL